MRTMAAATSTASCERPPVSETTPVRGGLALTGKPPIRPDRMLPAPTPTKSRSTSGGSSGSDGNDRVVAAVCTMTMTATISVSGTSCSQPADRDFGKRERRQRHRDIAENRRRRGFPIPATSRPRPPRPARSRRRECGHRSAPKSRSARTRQSRCRAENKLVCGAARPASPDAAASGRPSEGSPRIAGNCEIRMWTEMPARKPTVTGIDNKSAIQPRRKMPPITSTRPTISASTAASAA